MQQIMWARWLEVAVDHEMEARQCFRELVEQHVETLGQEFRASLVAVTASAYTVEAVFGEIKYLIPPQGRGSKRHNVIRDALRIAFGIADVDHQELAAELAWLFSLRDLAAHPYNELVPATRHPAGINTGVEHSQFNAVTSGRAVDAAVGVVHFAVAPPAPSSHWIARWTAQRATPSYRTVVASLLENRASQPLPT